MFSDNYVRVVYRSLVREGDECPCCGENRIDRLSWNDLGLVLCHECGWIWEQS